MKKEKQEKIDGHPALCEILPSLKKRGVGASVFLFLSLWFFSSPWTTTQSIHVRPREREGMASVFRSRPPLRESTGASNSPSHHARCFAVRGCRPGKTVTLTENEIRSLCVLSREAFLAEPNLLALKPPIKICGVLSSQEKKKQKKNKKKEKNKKEKRKEKEKEKEK
jgi:hypothetical protein